MQDSLTGEMLRLVALTEEAKDKAMPDRSRQGCVLCVGEVLDVKGGRFRVHSIGRKMVVLEGLPGTKVAGQ